MKLFWTISILFFCSFSYLGNDEIVWNEYKKLKWSDFKGKPNNNRNSFAALSSTGLMYKMICINGFFEVEVMPYFEPEESWVKREAFTDYHLQHEQLHFDITELFARKLRKEFDEKLFDCTQENDVEMILQSFIKQWEIEEKLYDEESHHSLNGRKQREWNQKIREELAALNEFRTLSTPSKLDF